MKTVTVYNRDGNETGTIDLPDGIFGIEPSITAIHQVVKAHLANKRQGNASTKTRSETAYTKSKMYRQKGTGRARAGSANNPNWIGGGVAFGPKPRSYRQKVNQNLRRLALKSAYSIKAAEDRIKVVEDFTLDEPKTKEIANMLHTLGIKEGKAIFLFGGRDNILYKSSKNIPKLKVDIVENAHTYEVMNSDVLLFMKSAVDRMKEVFKG
ncbi:MAG: 50S ribosomal protein L4 [Candidatus Latescibacteria bacterium]|jgi:large subunit ribosomal protein L4|nr:50S ribosomal protein L4 [Candidatus Latescibacterota bacterium]